MLPILRILPVGGVLLAIFILVLALSPPDGSRAPLNTTIAPARGALVVREHHPETRQFLIMAALKRADELNRLRDLPDTPTKTEPVPTEPVAVEPPATESTVEEPKVAGLPADRTESDPEPEEPTATETPSVSIPVETGEVSAPELPVSPPETNSTSQKPEQVREQIKPQQREIRRRAHRPRRPRATASAPQRPFNLFEVLFGGQQYRPSPQTYASQQSAQRQYQPQQPAYAAQSAQRQYQQPAYNPQPQLPTPPALPAPTEPYPMLRQHAY
ncbi:MAG TPA: hypothetical protein VFL49_09360 [Pseudolabrys sp.]|nr:hypothetical protein [Pseudolabrys sp.]